MKPTTLFKRLKAHQSIPAAIGTAEGIWAERIKEFLDTRPEKPSSENKSVKDAVWGMIELRPEEVAVIDSPPLQRLRRIRQLGLGYLTYPTAGYSRFEHTLGAVHQAERIIRAVALRSEDAHSEAILGALRVVRLAALVHDIGHLPLSHVSERFFSQRESIGAPMDEAEALRADVADVLRSPKVQLSECLSVAIVATESMGKVFERAGYEEEEVAKAALAIVGRPWDARQFFVAQLISNVIDADKLDYMFRDGFATRVPLAVDLERLLYKLKVVEAPSRILPAGKRGHIRHDETALVLGTDVAGDRLAYEVSQARSMLFERVYFHHKTRAAERVALRGLASLEMTATQLLGYDDELFGALGRVLFEDHISEVVSRLEDRRLPRRAFAISPAFASAQGLEELWLVDQDDDFSDEYLEESGVPDSRDAEGPDQLAKRQIDWTLNDPDKRRALEDAVLERFTQLASILEQDDGVEVWIDTAAFPPSTGDAALFIIRPDGEVGKDQGYAPAAAAETYEPLHIAFAFVDDPRDRRSLAYVACEFALQDQLDLVFERNAADFAKVEWDDVQEIKRTLEEKEPDIFSQHGRLRPQSQLANSAELVDRIEALGRTFHSYSSDQPVQVDVERIRAYLDQFPEGLVEPMVEALERLTFLDRAKFAGFAAFLRSSGPQDAVFVPLTSGAGKSADHLPYFFSDQEPSIEIRPLLEALELDRPIVVYDDLLLSGTQSEKIVRTWFGERKHRSSIVLSEEKQAALRERLDGFVFGWAWSYGVEQLTSVLKELGLSDRVEAMTEDGETGSLDGLSEGEELREFLSEVGYELLSSTRGSQPTNKWSQERCKQNALGYGNSERLVVTEYNAPAGTVTALWKQGAFRGAKWLPLFPRRRG